VAVRYKHYQICYGFARGKKNEEKYSESPQGSQGRCKYTQICVFGDNLLL